jgi:hypothetical protein
VSSERTVLRALAWLVAVVVIALGGAGIVAAMDPPPTVNPRSESTIRGDAAVTVVLDAAAAELDLLAADVDALGVDARGALASLNGADLTEVQAAIDRGDGRIDGIRDRAIAIQRILDGTPIVGTDAAGYELSDTVQARYERLVAAAGATGDLDAAWARLTVGSLAASRLAETLAAHDAAVLAAAELGRAARYEEAAASLDLADAAIADSRALRDRLVATVDVSTLDEWLDRNEAYDQALRGLYDALGNVGGRVTDAVRDAIEAERKAKDRLPPDARGLILIMGEIGRGGMDSAVVTIEQVRGRLDARLDDGEASGSGDDAGPEATAAP